MYGSGISPPLPPLEVGVCHGPLTVDAVDGVAPQHLVLSSGRFARRVLGGCLTALAPCPLLELSTAGVAVLLSFPL